MTETNQLNLGITVTDRNITCLLYDLVAIAENEVKLQKKFICISDWCERCEFYISKLMLQVLRKIL